MGVPAVRPIFRLLPMLVLPFLLLACEEQGSLAPPELELNQHGSAECPGPIASQIETVFVDEQKAALNKCDEIAKKVAQGQLEPALNKVDDFRDFAFAQLKNGGISSDEELFQLLSDLYAFVLAAFGSEDFVIPPEAFEEDGFVEIVDETGGVLTCETLLCGVDVPPGAFDGPTVIYASRLDDESDPLPTPLTQIPRFYEFDGSSPINEGFELTFGVCVDDFALQELGVPEGNIRLAHTHPEEDWRIEILPLASAPFLSCDAQALEGSVTERLWSRVASGLQSLLVPRPLQASAAVVQPGPLGGLAGAFSPFGAVDAEGTHKEYGSQVEYDDVWLAADLGTSTPSTGFETTGFDESGLSELAAPFGDVSALGATGNCSNLPRSELTADSNWEIGTLTDPTYLLMRSRVSLPGDAVNVRVWVAIDNDIRVFWNGTEVTASLIQSQNNDGLPRHTSDDDAAIDEEDGGTPHHTEGTDAGFQQHEGCAWEDDIAFDVDASDASIFEGDNLLVILGRDRGGLSWADVRVTAELGNGDPILIDQ